jgi:hypothetical protein
MLRIVECWNGAAPWEQGRLPDSFLSSPRFGGFDRVGAMSFRSIAVATALVAAALAVGGCKKSNVTTAEGSGDTADVATASSAAPDASSSAPSGNAANPSQVGQPSVTSS